MYIPQHFEETRPDVLHQLMRRYPLATIVTRTEAELNATHIPLLLQTTPGSLGILQGHVARANPMLGELSQAQETLIIFQGPDAYVSPRWYEDKALTGKVVPTWNYLAVHAYGTVSIHDEPEWLRGHLENLTAENEKNFETPWQVGDAPDEYITRMLRGIVGIQFSLSRIVGKWKLSQNKTQLDQRTIVEGLEAQSRPETEALAKVMEGAFKL